MAKPVTPISNAPVDVTNETTVEVDLQQSARDQIRKHIARKFSGHGLTRLVDALLQAQGFKTRLSPPKFPDLGRLIARAPG